MPPLAQLDPFWKVPNVYDSVGVAGLVLGLLSIWLSWWLAKRDLRKQAARLSERIALGWLEAELSEGLRCLREARRAARDRGWAAAVIRLDDAEYHMTRASSNTRLTEEERSVLRGMPEEVNTLVTAIRRIDRQDKGLSEQRMQALSALIVKLSEVGSRVRNTMTEA